MIPRERAKKLDTNHVANQSSQATESSSGGKRARHHLHKSKAQSTKSGKQGVAPAQMQTPPEHVRANIP